MGGEIRIGKGNLRSVKAQVPREVQGTLSKRVSGGGLRSIKAGLFAQDSAQGPLPMLLGHHHLEIGGGVMLRFTLAGLPFGKEADAQAPEHAHDPHPVGGADTASIVVMRDIQPLVGAVLDPPSKSVQLKPFLSGEFL